MFKSIGSLRIKLKLRKPKNLKLNDLTDMDVIQQGKYSQGVMFLLKGIQKY